MNKEFYKKQGLEMTSTFLILSIMFFLTMLKISAPTPKSKTARQRLNIKEGYPFQNNSIQRRSITINPSKQSEADGSVYQQSSFASAHSSQRETIEWNKTFLAKLEWKLFEDICMEYLRIKNCNAGVTCTGADGGIDIKVKDAAGKVIAVGQCKAWNKPIGVRLIRELYGVMASEKVKHGIFLTTSFFSKEAKEFAKNKALMLIGGEELACNINQLTNENKARIEKLVRLGDYSIPTCVHCNVKMVKRTTKFGPNEGNVFWGCVNYPKCKIMMKIAKTNS